MKHRNLDNIKNNNKNELRVCRGGVIRRKVLEDQVWIGVVGEKGGKVVGRVVMYGFVDYQGKFVFNTVGNWEPV